MGLAKAGLAKVIEHLYLYLHLFFILSDGFQMLCLHQVWNVIYPLTHSQSSLVFLSFLPHLTTSIFLL